MSDHRQSHDGARKIELPPHLRAWLDRRRAWHLDTVRVHAETRWIADGAKAVVAIYLADGQGRRGTALQRIDAKIASGRLVGPDGARGVAHTLDWALPVGAAGATGLLAEVSVPDYQASATSQHLELDLQPYSISG